MPREEDILQVAYPTSAYKYQPSPTRRPLDSIDANPRSRSSESVDFSSSSSQVSSSPSGGSLLDDSTNDTVVVGTGATATTKQGDVVDLQISTDMILSVGGAKPIKTSTPVYNTSWGNNNKRNSVDLEQQQTEAAMSQVATESSPRNSASYSNIAGQSISPRNSTHMDSQAVLSSSSSGYRSSYTPNSSSSSTPQKPQRTFKITSIFGGTSPVRQVQPTDTTAIKRSEVKLYTDGDASSRSPSSPSKNNGTSSEVCIQIGNPSSDSNQYSTQVVSRQQQHSSSKPHSTSLDNMHIQQRDRSPESTIVLRNQNGKHTTSVDNLRTTAGNTVRLQIATPGTRKLSLQVNKPGDETEFSTSSNSTTITRRYYSSETTQQTQMRERSCSSDQSMAAGRTIKIHGRTPSLSSALNETRKFGRQTSYEGPNQRVLHPNYQPRLLNSTSSDSVRLLTDVSRQSRSATVSSVGSASSVPESDRTLTDESGSAVATMRNKRNSVRIEQEYLSPTVERKLLSHSQNSSELRRIEVLGNKGHISMFRSGSDIKSAHASSSRGHLSSQGSMKQSPESVRMSYNDSQNWSKGSIESAESAVGVDESDSWLWEKRNSRMDENSNPNSPQAKGRTRERSLERDRRRERTMHERHRSRSYDRSHQRTTGWVRHQDIVRHESRQDHSDQVLQQQQEEQRMLAENMSSVREQDEHVRALSPGSSSSNDDSRGFEPGEDIVHGNLLLYECVCYA